MAKVEAAPFPLPDQRVEFILRTLGYSNLSDKNNGFWLAPHVINNK